MNTALQNEQQAIRKLPVSLRRAAIKKLHDRLAQARVVHLWHSVDGECDITEGKKFPDVISNTLAALPLCKRVEYLFTRFPNNVFYNSDGDVEWGTSTPVFINNYRSDLSDYDYCGNDEY